MVVLGRSLFFLTGNLTVGCCAMGFGPFCISQVQKGVQNLDGGLFSGN